MAKPKDLEKRKYMFTDDIKFLQKAVIFHPEDKNLFLVLKRLETEPTRPGDWDLVGGNVLYGELHDESLIREIKEETGLKIDKLTPAQIITNYDETTKGIYIIFNGFYCRALSSQVKIGKNEHSEFRWVTKDEFIELSPAQYLIDLVKTVNELCF